MRWILRPQVNPGQPGDALTESLDRRDRKCLDPNVRAAEVPRYGVVTGARRGTSECLVYLIFCAIIATGYSLASHFRVYFRNEADERLIRDLA